MSAPQETPSPPLAAAQAVPTMAQLFVPELASQAVFFKSRELCGGGSRKGFVSGRGCVDPGLGHFRCRGEGRGRKQYSRGAASARRVQRVWKAFPALTLATGLPQPMTKACHIPQSSGQPEILLVLTKPHAGWRLLSLALPHLTCRPAPLATLSCVIPCLR